jgi:seryl-tRNA synthetase
MHDIRVMRDNPDAFDNALARRGLPPQAQRLIALDEQRRAKILALETAQARRNAASKEIGEAKKNKDEEKAKGLLNEVAALKETMPAMEVEEKTVSKALDDALAEIPNLPMCPTARTRKITSSTIASVRSAITHLRRSSILISAKHSAKWISRPQQNSPAHALWS